MDRGTWQATVHGVARVEHDLATNPPPIFLLSVSLSDHKIYEGTYYSIRFTVASSAIIS